MSAKSKKSPDHKDDIDNSDYPSGLAKSVWYESREKEPTSFEVDGIKPIRNFSNGHLEWEVPIERDELFKQHFFVQTARVVRKRV